MRPSVIAFDVNETLSDLSPLGARFLEVGASASAAPLWFASVLRDGFALTAAGENPPFAGVAREQLLSQLADVQLNRSLDEAAQHVMEGFASLELHVGQLAEQLLAGDPGEGWVLPCRGEREAVAEDGGEPERSGARGGAHLQEPGTER